MRTKKDLTPEERETIILTSDADDTVEIYTFDSGFIGQLREMQVRDPAHCRLRKSSEELGCATFDVAKPFIRILLGCGDGSAGGPADSMTVTLE
jgi:hypothetical protein